MQDLPLRIVLLCGGTGTRLWPLSRTHYPKQFLKLTNEYSLLQNTLKRLEGFDSLSKTVIVANENHRFLLAEQLAEMNYQADILLEPVPRNTAPAIGAAASFVEEQKESSLLLILPADHVILDTEGFIEAIRKATPFAQSGKAVTFGIVPTAPQTGYGYIQCGKKLNQAFELKQFVEKPNVERAKEYLASGNYLWNSGIFLFRSDTYLSLLEELNQPVFRWANESVQKAQKDLHFYRLDKESFEKCPSISIDYAVMEKIQDGVVIPLDVGWNDIGEWDAIAEVSSKDKEGNVIRGDVLTIDSKNSVFVSDGKLVTALGLDNLVVVATQDAVLVADKKQSQAVKNVVEALKKQERIETDFLHVVHRPWGSYETLAQGDRYLVKKIRVKVGASLSLQMHHHRAEHWVIVKGTAKIKRGDEELLLSENQSTYIPLGVIHRLENPGLIDLEIIEVQSGSLLDEKDIIRFEDNYGR